MRCSARRPRPEEAEKWQKGEWMKNKWIVAAMLLCAPMNAFAQNRTEAPPFADPQLEQMLTGLDNATWNQACGIMREVQHRHHVRGLLPHLTTDLKKKFLKWWLDYLEAMSAYEMLDGYLTSPFHYPADEDRIRTQTRNQITALTEGAKKKLLQRLR